VAQLVEVEEKRRGFDLLIDHFHTTFNIDIHSFPASIKRENCGYKAGNFVCFVIGQGTERTDSILK